MFQFALTKFVQASGLSRWKVWEHVEYLNSRFAWFDKITLDYLIIWLVLIAAFYPSFPSAKSFMIIDLLLILVLIVLVGFPFRTAVGKFFRYLYILFYIALFFTAYHYLIPVLHSGTFDSVFIALDHRIFGVHPTVWLQRWINPYLVEYFQWSYTAYYFIPIILGTYLYFKNRTAELEKFLFATCLGFYISYFGYFLFPALGPRFYLAEFHTQPLNGVFISSGIDRVLNLLEGIQYDAFPSGHTAVILITIVYTKKLLPRWFYPVLWIGFSMVLSTVYLRYHYVVDVLGGILVALIALFVAGQVEKRIRQS